MTIATAHCAEILENACMRRQNNTTSTEQHQETRAPDQVIDQQRDKAAADARQRHLDRHQFRRIDAKLV